jgi:hypothetical protein
VVVHVTTEERAAELTAEFTSGVLTADQFQTALAALLASNTEPEPDNHPPSPLYVWNGAEWLLPAEHEEDMLTDMQAEGVISDEEHAENLAVVQERLVEQRERAGE